MQIDIKLHIGRPVCPYATRRCYDVIGDVKRQRHQDDVAPISRYVFKKKTSVRTSLREMNWFVFQDDVGEDFQFHCDCFLYKIPSLTSLQPPPIPYPTPTHHHEHHHEHHSDVNLHIDGLSTYMQLDMKHQRQHHAVKLEPTIRLPFDGL